jgi:DNA (cytosine-5)-methyltransferase 1
MVKIKKRYPAIDIYSGCGGLSLGLIEAGFEIRAAVEIDKVAAETYRRNIGDVVINKDVRQINGEYILDVAGLERGKCVLLAGCAPCQGFSAQNRNKRKNDPRNFLVLEFVRLVKEIEPLFILMENVPGLINGTGRQLFERAREQLYDAGYTIKEEIINAADYGVPQIRMRAVIIGCREKINLRLPEPTHSENPFDQSGRRLKPWRTVRDAIGDLPPIKAGEEHKTIIQHRAARLGEKNLLRIRNIPKNGGSRFDLPRELWLECHKRNPKAYRDVYGRMSWDRPAPTLTGGCTNITKGRFGHPEQDRGISIREAARLQTFPDDFVFSGSMKQIQLQIGNAFPVLLARVIGETIVEMIEELPDEIKKRYGVI